MFGKAMNPFGSAPTGFDEPLLDLLVNKFGHLARLGDRVIGVELLQSSMSQPGDRRPAASTGRLEVHDPSFGLLWLRRI